MPGLRALRECPEAAPRGLLKGLPLIPIPASFFLLRTKEAAAAGIGPAAGQRGDQPAGGGSAVGAGAGLTRIRGEGGRGYCRGSVAGGAGYGVSTGNTKDASVDRKVAQALGVGAPRDVRGATDIRSAHAGRS